MLHHWQHTDAPFETNLNLNLVLFAPIYNRFQLAGMARASEVTDERSSVIVQQTEVCNYGQVRYNLASALGSGKGYDLTTDFKNAVKNLPSTYSKSEYTEFLDNWGTVSRI